MIKKSCNLIGQETQLAKVVVADDTFPCRLSPYKKSKVSIDYFQRY